MKHHASTATRLHILVAVVFLTVMPRPVPADFKDGLEAFDGGDLATAYREWRSLAEAGDAEAQVALAGLYMAGAGVPADAAEAARWYRRAAAQGDAVAQLNLGDLYGRGRGVERDLVQAYLWLSLAMAQGRNWPKLRRAEIARFMTEAEIAEAERLVRAWKPSD